MVAGKRPVENEAFAKKLSKDKRQTANEYMAEKWQLLSPIAFPEIKKL